MKDGASDLAGEDIRHDHADAGAVKRWPRRRLDQFRARRR